ALNAHDDIAFTSMVTGGGSRNGLFVASPTTLDTPLALVRLTGKRRRDRIRLNLLLHLGRLTNGIAPGPDQASVSLSPADGVLWSATVPGSKMRAHGKAFVATGRHGASYSPELQSLRLTVGSDGSPRVLALSGPLDLTQGGQRPLTAPVSVTLQVG